MRTRFNSERTTSWILPLWAAAALIVAGAMPAHAGVLFSDDFNSGLGGGTSAGTPLDPSIWESTAADLAAAYPIAGTGATVATLDGLGNAQIKDNAEPQILVTANQYDPSSYPLPLQLTIGMASDAIIGGTTGETILGFNDLAGSSRINVRNDSGGDWIFKMANGGSDTTVDTGIPIADVGTWVFTWSRSPNDIVVSFDGTTVVHLTAGNFPTIALPALVYGEAGVNDTIDMVSLTTPEPASLAVLAVGGVLTLSRRRRTA